MAITTSVKVYPYPKGESMTDRWQIFHGVISVTGSGNYTAGGLALTWNPMVNQLNGANVLPMSTSTIPDYAIANSIAGSPWLYDISSTGNLIISPGAGITNTAATASAFSVTSNVVTITATNTFAAGDTVYLQGFATATWLNGAVVTVISTGLSGSQFEFNFTHANTSGSDTGTATRTTIAVGSAVPLSVISDTIVFEAFFAKD